MSEALLDGSRKRKKPTSVGEPVKGEKPGSAPQPTLRSEIEKRLGNERLTPAHRRIVQILLENESQIGFLSSMELAKLAQVSQPSVTRLAAALGFDGFSDMRRCFRGVASAAPSVPKASGNRFQSAAEAEAANVAAMAEELGDVKKIRAMGSALASSRPLVVLGLRASAGLASHFAYFASKVHPDVRLIVNGGSMAEDTLEQAHIAGAKTLLAFAMPLYPRETSSAIAHAKQLGLKVLAVATPGFDVRSADLKLTARIHSSLVFDSCASASLLISVLLDAMCDANSQYAEDRLERNDESSSKRKVFVR